VAFVVVVPFSLDLLVKRKEEKVDGALELLLSQKRLLIVSE